ncbi:uncharacterized protein [Hyperolius riggenbachi]|uniref:uncharacterized protein n=1 Tax=Hyperolius riggenbachi TaxID=752182 RepID=UPI0035A3D516
MPNCIIVGCPNFTGKDENISLHCFPNTVDKIKLWLERTGQTFVDIDALSSKILKGKPSDLYRVCSNHFTPECYKTKTKRKTLVKDAAPSIFPSNTNNVVINEEAVMTSGKPKNIDLPPKKKKKFRHLIELGESTYSCPHCYRIYKEKEKVRCKNISTQTEDLSSTQSDLLSDSGSPSSVQYMENPYNIVYVTLENPSETLSSAQIPLQPSLPSLYESPITLPQSTITLPVLVESTISNVAPFNPLPSHPQAEGNSEDQFDSRRPMESSCSILDQGKDSDEQFNRFDFSLDKSEISALCDLQESTRTGSPSDPDEYFKNIAFQRKFIVFESCLDNLIQKMTCLGDPACNRKIKKFNKQMQGSAVIVRGECEDGHDFKIFESQPKIKRYYAGNLLLAASALCTGLNFTRLNDFLTVFGMQFFSEKTFHDYQKKYLFPAISRAWTMEKENLKQELFNEPVTVAGDGQCDSRGHSAKYCMYTLMDLLSGKILDFEVVQSTQCSSSVAMEKFAFEKCIARVIDDGYEIIFFASDRHADIQKVMREQYPHINHQFDVWHYAKNISQKIRKFSQNRTCSTLTPWISELNNHFWWAIKNCENDPEKLRKNWQSLLHHVVNEHEWVEDGEIRKCAHQELSENQVDESMWLDRETPAYERLTAIVNNKQLLNDLPHLTWSCHTGPLEKFHSNVLKYRSKRSHYSSDDLECRTILAALSNNFNVNRLQAGFDRDQKGSRKKGSKRYSLVPPKGKNKRVLRNKFEKKNWGFLSPILVDTLKMCEGTLETDWVSKSDSLPLNISTVPKPDIEDMIAERSKPVWL